MALKEVEQEQEPSSPRISFSSELLDDSNFISINLTPIKTEDDSKKRSMISTDKPIAPEFEFAAVSRTQGDMPTADELFFEGKLLPLWQTLHSAKLKSLNLQRKEIEEVAAAEEKVLTGVKDEGRLKAWFIDDDPSPRLPKCTVLWKDLLRLKKRQRGSTLSPSSASSSSSLSSISLERSNEMEKSGDSKTEGNFKNANAAFRSQMPPKRSVFLTKPKNRIPPGMSEGQNMINKD